MTSVSRLNDEAAFEMFISSNVLIYRANYMGNGNDIVHASHFMSLFYRQAGKNSLMRMNVEGRLMQLRFIEIHQVFGKK